MEDSNLAEGSIQIQHIISRHHEGERHSELVGTKTVGAGHERAGLKNQKKQDLVSSKELIIGGQGENGSHECSGNHLVGRASVLRRTSFRSRRVVQYQIYLWDGIWGAIGSSVESSRSIQASVVFIHSPNIRCRSFVHSYIRSFV